MKKEYIAWSGVSFISSLFTRSGHNKKEKFGTCAFTSPLDSGYILKVYLILMNFILEIRIGREHEKQHQISLPYSVHQSFLQFPFSCSFFALLVGIIGPGKVMRKSGGRHGQKEGKWHATACAISPTHLKGQSWILLAPLHTARCQPTPTKQSNQYEKG